LTPRAAARPRVGAERRHGHWERAPREREDTGLVIGEWRLDNSGVFEPVALAGERYDPGVVQEPVKDGGGCGDVVEELAPILERAVGGHEGGSVFVAAHDDLEQVLPGMLGQLLEPHVVDDEEIGLQVLAQGAVLLVEGLLLEEVSDEIEDGDVANEAALLDGLVADGLGQVGLAEAGRPEKKDVGGLGDELASGQLEDLLLRDLGVEAPVEVLEGLEAHELGVTLAVLQMALFADVELVLEDIYGI